MPGDKYSGIVITVGDRMFLEMQDFDFAQILSNLLKFKRFCPNFASICPNPTKFAQI